MDNRLVRSFIAIELPESLREEIYIYVRQLSIIAPEVKWVGTDSMHITIKFLGNQQPGVVSQAKRKLSQLKFNIPPFEIRTGQFGAFPNLKAPRVYWLGIKAEPEKCLVSLNKIIEDAMEEVGIEREQRQFSAHLTLGRIRDEAHVDVIESFVKNQNFKSFNFKVETIALVRSMLRPDGAEYSVMQQYPLFQK
jgi:2'-5' RNA ligase